MTAKIPRKILDLLQRITAILSSLESADGPPEDAPAVAAELLDDLQSAIQNGDFDRE